MWNSTPLGLGNGLTGELQESFLLSLPFCKTEVKRPVGEQSKMDLSAFLCWILISNESCWKSNDHPVCKNRTSLPEDCKWLSPWSKFPGRIWILHTWRILGELQNVTVQDAEQYDLPLKLALLWAGCWAGDLYAFLLNKNFLGFCVKERGYKGNVSYRVGVCPMLGCGSMGSSG